MRSRERWARALPDWVAILEATYDVLRDEPSWLEGIARSADPCLNEGLGLLAFTFEYNPARVDRFTVGPLRMRGIRYGDEAFHRQGLEGLARIPGYVPQAFGKLLCGTASGLGYSFDVSAKAMAEHGVQDVLGVTGADASGQGCSILAYLPERRRVTAAQGAVLGRIATHLATALRLRRALHGESRPAPVAVVAADGRSFEPSAALDESWAGPALMAAARQVELARGPLRASDSARALAAWRGRVRRRWTLVEAPAGGASRRRGELVAFENAPPLSLLALVLTDRELEIASFLTRGHTTKLIAYELGVADSTVRVLVARIAKRLGTRRRAELIARLSQLEASSAAAATLTDR